MGEFNQHLLNHMRTFTLVIIVKFNTSVTPLFLLVKVEPTAHEYAIRIVSFVNTDTKIINTLHDGVLGTNQCTSHYHNVQREVVVQYI